MKSDQPRKDKLAVPATIDRESLLIDARRELKMPARRAFGQATDIAWRPRDAGRLQYLRR